MLSLNGIMFRGSVLVVAVVFACSLVAGAAAVDPKQLYDQSSDAMYNLDFNTAQHGYEALTREYPDNPDYWNALASSIWLKIMFDQQKLNLESFLRPLDIRNERISREASTRKTKSVFATRLQCRSRESRCSFEEESERRARPLRQRNFERRHWRALKVRSNVLITSAISDAKAAKTLHQQVLKLDPTSTMRGFPSGPMTMWSGFSQILPRPRRPVRNSERWQGMSGFNSSRSLRQKVRTRPRTRRWCSPSSTPGKKDTTMRSAS